MRVRRLFVLAGIALVVYGCGELVSSSSNPTPSAADASPATDAPPPSPLDACVPRTCASASATCGSILDKCGGEIPDCGTCGDAMYCNNNACSGTPCKPKTVAEVCIPGICGKTSDGCGGFVQCPSTCPTDQTCGTDGTCKPICNEIAGGCAVLKGLGVSCNGSTVNGTRLMECSKTPSFAADCALCASLPGTKQYYCCP